MSRRFVIAVFLASAAICTTTAEAQQVSLALNNGRVSLRAENATLRQILAEWERQGQVRIVGADRLAGAPLTLTLTDISEREALEIVLRGAPGYMVVERVGTLAGHSLYDRVFVLPRASTPAGGAPSRAAAQSPVQPQPFANVPAAGLAGDKGDGDQVGQNDADEDGPPQPNAPVLNPYGSGALQPSNAAGTVGVQPPETQFDYANPQRYFERMQQQVQQGQSPTNQQPNAITPVPGVAMPGGANPAVPGVMPSAGPLTTSKPGMTPVPPPPQPSQQPFFNPYNLPPGATIPPSTAPQGPPVEPDRSKYANPYAPPQKP